MLHSCVGGRQNTLLAATIPIVSYHRYPRTQHLTNIYPLPSLSPIRSHCRQLFLSMHRLDRGLLSEPMMAVQAFVEYQRLAGDRERLAW